MKETASTGPSHDVYVVEGKSLQHRAYRLRQSNIMISG